MSVRCDIAILGGGPAGRAAAAWIGGAATVRLLDEPPPADPMRWGMPDSGHRAWGVGREDALFRLDAIGADGSLVVLARSLVVCTGAHPGALAPWPATEATRLLGAAHGFRPERGGWVPLLRDGQRTSIAGLYAAGDCTGLAGDAAGEGAAAAAAALADLGIAGRPAPVPRTPDPVDLPRQPPEAIACRCEGVTGDQIAAAIAGGARDINQLKSFTRAGMGICQARLCADGLARLMGAHVGLEPSGLPTARLPLRPVPLAALLGDFAYGDIPVPKAAPI